MTGPRRRRFGVRIAEIQRQTGIPHDSVLRDHALSYMLAGIAGTGELSRHLVFKGGTALRKCYFAGYRYSEDLDFSTRELHAWTAREIGTLLDAACERAQELAELVEAPYTFEAHKERHREDRPSQHNYRVAVTFPTGASLPIKVELTQDEPIVRPVERCALLHQFAGEQLAVEISVYSLDEIVLEKLRAFLQTAANLERRDWTNRARDLYDLWWLWTHQAPVPWIALRAPLAEKAAARSVSFDGPVDFLDRRVLRAYRDSWHTRLGNVVPELPPFEESLASLCAVLATVFEVEPPAVALD